MSKPLKHKKDKVPKITEEEYAAYVKALKEGTQVQCKADLGGKTKNGNEKERKGSKK